MRYLHHIAIIATAIVALLASSCDRDNDLYNIAVEKQISCSFDRQVIKIEYSLAGTTPEGEAYSVTATASDDWVTSIDYPRPGVIAVEVEANGGELRTTTIAISATGHATAKVKLTQLGAPSDASHTLMYYFFGTSLSRFFDQNLDDAKKAIEDGILGENNRVLFFRQKGRSTAYIGELCYDPVNGGVVERIIKDDISIEGALVTPEAVGANIAMMAEEAPAQRYGLILAGHGHGWITREALNSEEEEASTFSHTPYVDGIKNSWQPAAGAEITRAFGENNVQVDITELASGIELSGVDIEYILFDACFMSNIEAIYDLRNVTDYVIASPCEIMGRGFPYHRTLPFLFQANGASSDLRGAAESYYKYYRDEYTSNARCGSVAVYDCAEMDALAEATRAVVATATNDYDPSKLQTYEGQPVHIFYDFGQWAETVATDEAALAAFRDQLSRTIIAKYTLSSFYSAYGVYGTYPIDEDIFSGATTSAPSAAYPAVWSETNWHKTVWE
uniref:clostripain-related cysteine peptidase n=1 Tax=Alistipes sp. TaxID=1872444 RepID=UPI0040576A45